MRPSECVACATFPCTDVRHECYVVPDIVVEPDRISVILISEAAPATAGDYYYAAGDSLFQQTTVQAFNDAGANVSSIADILNLGVYLYRREMRQNWLRDSDKHHQGMLTPIGEGACPVPEQQGVVADG